MTSGVLFDVKTDSICTISHYLKTQQENQVHIILRLICTIPECYRSNYVKRLPMR